LPASLYRRSRTQVSSWVSSFWSMHYDSLKEYLLF